MLETRLETETGPVVEPLIKSGLLKALTRTGTLLDDMRGQLATLEEHNGTSLQDLATLDDTCSEEEAKTLSTIVPSVPEAHFRILTTAQLVATRSYATHLAKIDTNLLLAHAYTRYLGDLSGGQHILKKVAKKYPCPNGAGFAFYSFDGDARVLKDQFRVCMEQGVSYRWIQRLVDEANTSFDLNAELFESLVHEDLRMRSEEIPEQIAVAVAKTSNSAGKLAYLVLLLAASAILVAIKLQYSSQPAPLATVA